MHFAYAQSALEPRMPDEMFLDEANALEGTGHSIHRVDIESLAAGTTRIRPGFESGSKVVYRGWMLTQTDYENLAASVVLAGGMCLTSPERYVATHHLPNWYAVVADYTPETVVLGADADLVSELRHLGWDRFFIKDFVKSLKTSVGSIVDRPEHIDTVVSEMEKYRGFIEGGLCIRRVEDFVAGSEQRYFVLNHVPFASDPAAPIPNAVAFCAGKIESPFFSVDIALRSDGVERLVELGDGQVSDLVGWSEQRFADLWRDAG